MAYRRWELHPALKTYCLGTDGALRRRRPCTALLRPVHCTPIAMRRPTDPVGLRPFGAPGLGLFLLGQGQHGAAARRRPAQAAVAFFQLPGDPAVEHQAVVVEQLFAARDIAQRHDIDALAVAAFLRFAVGVARVVDPARVVAFVAAVDDAAGTQREEEGMERIVRIGGCRRSASSALMRLPPYSMMRVPAGILRVAKTPLPCSLERRTECQGLMISVIGRKRRGRASGPLYRRRRALHRL